MGTELETDWGDMLDALKVASETILDGVDPSHPVDPGERLRFLTRFLAAASAFEMDGDPAYPHLTRVFSPTNNWFLPCPDGIYHYAVLDGRYSYRITGTRGTSHVVVAEVFEGGFFDVPGMRVFDSTRIETGVNGEIDIRLDSGGADGNALKIPPGPSLVLVRQWFYDWEREEQGQFAIERVGEEYPVPPVSADELQARWHRYVEFVRTAATSMAASAAQHYSAPADRIPFPQMMGAVSRRDDDDPYSMRGQVYGTGYYNCGPDEAVILEVRPPQCEYWSIALYSQNWEVMDWLHRSSSINGRQAALDHDGVFRAVISQRDPGVANWLDPGGRSFGLIGVRYFGTESVPEPTLRTVRFDELRRELPAETPTIEPAARQEALARRARIMRARFRP